MHNSDSPAYRKASLQYLRKGTPLDIALKAAEQERRPSQYIWRTMGDGKVRPAHAANDGRLFSWDIRPSTGYPGEELNCRCKAEAYIKGESEFAYQELVFAANDATPKWKTLDFLKHHYFGNGRTVLLEQIGHLSGLINHYFYSVVRDGKDSRSRVNSQIIEAARNKGWGAFSYVFNNSYTELGDYLWVFGGGTISGVFNGNVHPENGMLVIQGNVEYRYQDTFTDLVNARQRISHGTSNPEEASILTLLATDFYGVYFDILGSWKTQFSSEVKENRQSSVYR